MVHFWSSWVLSFNLRRGTSRSMPLRRIWRYKLLSILEAVTLALGRWKAPPRSCRVLRPLTLLKWIQPR